MKHPLLLLLLMLFALPAQGEPITADISQHEIDIHTTFRGVNLLLFGARGDAGTIVVVVRGPASDVVVRKKARIGGIWLNRYSQTYLQIPSYYQIASSRPLGQLENQRLLQAIGIGGEFLFPEQVLGDARNQAFWAALVESKRQQGLYAAEEGHIAFWGETLFKTALSFPKNIPRGDYQAEIYLLRDASISALQTLPIRVEKIGFEAYVSRVAHQQPVLYGVVCVALALLAGWIASSLFRKI